MMRHETCKGKSFTVEIYEVEFTPNRECAIPTGVYLLGELRSFSSHFETYTLFQISASIFEGSGSAGIFGFIPKLWLS